MIIAYKNYKRTKNVLLSITSVRHFMPNVEIHCLNLFDNSPSEYPFDSNFDDLRVKIHFEKSKHKCGPGAFSPCNGFYFTEYLNYFSMIFKGEKKVLALDEDNYFTTGETLRWMNENEFDLAWAHWWIGINASIVGINFQALENLFPLPEKKEYIEVIIRDELYAKALEMGKLLKEIPTRNWSNYFGDGSHTNDINIIKNDLMNLNIIPKEKL